MAELLLRPFAAIGNLTLSGLESMGRAWRLFAGATVSMRSTDVWTPLLLPQMARIGVASVPIALFIATFTGIVMALQASYSLTGAIPPYFVGTLVGKTMILELGPVLTGLVLAGRVGANISAELGTMRVTEQVDALETLAYDPLAYLVVPRLLAGIIMFPVVVLLAISIGIAGRVVHRAPAAGDVLDGVREGPAHLLRAVGRVVRGDQVPVLRCSGNRDGLLLRAADRGRGRGGGTECHARGGRRLHDHPLSGRLLGGGAPLMRPRQTIVPGGTRELHPECRER